MPMPPARTACLRCEAVSAPATPAALPRCQHMIGAQHAAARAEAEEERRRRKAEERRRAYAA